MVKKKYEYKSVIRENKSTLRPYNLLYRELLLSFIDYLLQEYTRNPGGDPEITKLVGESDLHIIPTMNPDGFEKAEKGDCKGFSRQSGKHMTRHQKYLNFSVESF